MQQRVRLIRWNESVWFWVRTHRRAYTLLVLAVLATSVLLGYRSLTRTTEFTSDAAVEEFLRRSAAPLSPPPAPPSSEGGIAEVAGPQGTQPGGKAGGGVPAPAQTTCDWVCPDSFTPPEPGVYEYFQCGRTTGQCTGSNEEPEGTETFGGGLSRSFKRTGQRIITLTSSYSWNNVHNYMNEHVEEFDLSINNTGVFDHSYRVTITIGPAGGGSEIKQNPPIQFARWPLQLGSSWAGSWKDDKGNADGDYACSTDGKEALNIGVKQVRTWLVSCGLQLKGPRQTGRVDFKLWLSPEYRNTLQETYDQKLSTPDGPYEGRWMATLADLTPRKR